MSNYCDTTGNLFPSARGCKTRQCPDLVEQEYPWGNGEYRKRWICQVTGRIPGNMATCPKEEGTLR
jgi:hypothetical protein